MSRSFLFLQLSNPSLSPSINLKGGGVTLTFLFIFLLHVTLVEGQMLSYLIVIDFESTCWKNKKGFQEISKYFPITL